MLFHSLYFKLSALNGCKVLQTSCGEKADQESQGFINFMILMFHRIMFVVESSDDEDETVNEIVETLLVINII